MVEVEAISLVLEERYYLSPPKSGYWVSLALYSTDQLAIALFKKSEAERIVVRSRQKRKERS